MSELNTMQSSQPLQFDMSRDFELWKAFKESEQSEQPEQSEQFKQLETKTTNDMVQSKQLEPNQTEQFNNMIRTLPFINNNIRTNIKLGIEIYKQLNNFDRNYIHTIINEHSAKSNE